MCVGCTCAYSLFSFCKSVFCVCVCICMKSSHVCVHVSIGLQLVSLISFSSMNDITQFYNGDCMLPVYKRNQSKEHYPLDALAKLLITDTVPSSNICSKQPVQVCRNVSFVVDLNMLDDPLDIRADENGVWCYQMT